MNTENEFTKDEIEIFHQQETINNQDISKRKEKIKTLKKELDSKENRLLGFLLLLLFGFTPLATYVNTWFYVIGSMILFIVLLKIFLPKINTLKSDILKEEKAIYQMEINFHGVLTLINGDKIEGQFTEYMNSYIEKNSNTEYFKDKIISVMKK